MKTVTARELRENLDEIVQRVRGGETIRVTYRSKPAFILQPEKLSESIVRGSEEAMKQFLNETIQLSKSKKRSSLNPKANIKELYHGMLDNDLKYQNLSNK